MVYGGEGVFMILLFLLLCLFSGISFAQEMCSEVLFVGDFTEQEKEILVETKDKVRRNNFLKTIQRNFENNGFVGANLYEKCKGDTLYFVNEKGEGFVYGVPRNKLLTKTKPEVFVKLSGIVPGEKVVLDDLSRAVKKMERSGHFIKVKEPELYREKNRNRLVPLFYMQETSSSFIEGFLSYSSEDEKWIGVLDVSLKNILGTARNLDIEGVSGDIAHRISFEYLEPWIFGTEWNALARGILEDDTLYSDALLEIGVSRSLSFEWEFTVWGGVGNNEWTTAVGLSYQNFDAFYLPTSGTSANIEMRVKNYRKGNLENFVSLFGNYEKYFLLSYDWVARFGFSGATLLPTGNVFANEDLFRLGGSDSWKGFRKDFIKTRSYGNTEVALRFQGLWQTAFEVFYQPGIYREMFPYHGWKTHHQYGLGIIQYRSSFAVSLYYALRPELDFEEGFLHLGIKALF